MAMRMQQSPHAPVGLPGTDGSRIGGAFSMSARRAARLFARLTLAALVALVVLLGSRSAEAQGRREQDERRPPPREFGGGETRGGESRGGKFRGGDSRGGNPRGGDFSDKGFRVGSFSVPRPVQARLAFARDP